MHVNGKKFRTIWFENNIVKIIDQTKLPHQFIIKDLKTIKDSINAIKTMEVRGAPLIGATAAYGLVLSIIERNDQSFLKKSSEDLIKSRPTAINLKWAVDRMMKKLSGVNSKEILNIARMGVLPIVNSFASFLTARGNEQIYNNSTEITKIIYICLYAGAIPAGAGKSHQSLRDISLLSNIPNLRIFHPYNDVETEQVLKHCLKKDEKNNCAIRLSIGHRSNYAPELHSNYSFKCGEGNEITKGTDAIIFVYGQTMITECFKASKLLKEKNFSLEIVNLPCLNYFDLNWVKQKIKKFENIFFIDDHNFSGGMGDLMIAFLSENNLLKKKSIKKFGYKDFPACGAKEEVLKFHSLDHKSIANQIMKKINA